MHAVSDSECSSDDDASILTGKAAIKTNVTTAVTTSTRKESSRIPASSVVSAACRDSIVDTQESALGILPLCAYGATCYRKNPAHLAQYRHSAHDTASDTDAMPVKKPRVQLSPPPRGMLDELCSKYDFYLSSVRDFVERQNSRPGSLSLKDILSLPVGELLESVQFNYMFDVKWLLDQYPKAWRERPLLLVHGKQRDAKIDFQLEVEPYANVHLCQAKLEMIYGTHHTKMMFLMYDVGLRIVVTTANLIEQDWDQKTQGVWLSPLLPRGEADSPTSFKRDLLEYLNAYKAASLTPWIERVRQCDMSAIRVFLVSSVPGRHSGDRKSLFGHMKLRKLLQQYVEPKAMVDSGSEAAAVRSGTSISTAAALWPVVGQFSSVGSLGGSADQWLCKEWLTSLAAVKRPGSTATANLHPLPRPPPLRLVYPTVDNVRQSLEGYLAGSSLPYSSATAQKQRYLVSYLCQWKAETRGRTYASPHIKSYMRASPDYSQMAWFLLTSANLSKAAWGALEKQSTQLMIRSYELGVLFVPSCFISSDSFDVDINSTRAFPLPYDIPLTLYSKTDEPWLVDVAHTTEPDRHGCIWQPH